MTLTLNQILNSISEFYKIDSKEIVSKSRNGKVVKARQMYCFLSRIHTICSLSIIGNKINRDHSTIIYSIKEIQNKMEIYCNIKDEISKIECLLEIKSIDSNILIPKYIDLLYIAENNNKKK